MIETYEVINSIQVGLTFTFVAMCLVLIKTWGPSVGEALSGIDGWRFWRAWSVWSAEQWLAAGIVIGFAGAIADNLYWGLTWFAVHYQLPAESALMKNGPVSNVFSRQIPGIVSVYCHIYAAKKLHDTKEDVAIKYYFLGGLGICIALMLTVPR